MTFKLNFNIIYTQSIETRRIILAWTDEDRQSAIDAYVAAEPTAETSTEIVAEIAEDMGQTVNGVRMVLTRAGVYIKKEGKASPSKGGGTGRVSKADAQQALTGAIEAAGQEADEEIISKLTGKAAVYFTGVINAINS